MAELRNAAMPQLADYGITSAISAVTPCLKSTLLRLRSLCLPNCPTTYHPILKMCPETIDSRMPCEAEVALDPLLPEAEAAAEAAAMPY